MLSDVTYSKVHLFCKSHIQSEILDTELTSSTAFKIPLLLPIKLIYAREIRALTSTCKAGLKQHLRSSWALEGLSCILSCSLCFLSLSIKSPCIWDKAVGSDWAFLPYIYYTALSFLLFPINWDQRVSYIISLSLAKQIKIDQDKTLIWKKVLLVFLTQGKSTQPKEKKKIAK